MVDAHAARDAEHLVLPGGRVDVVDDVLRAELLRDFELGGGAGGGDDGGAGGDGDLEGPAAGVE